MKRLLILLFSIGTITLSACRAGFELEDDYYTHAYGPELDAFHVIDSYGINSEFDRNTPLSISPYIDNGFFELSWQVSTNQSYRAELFINDQPNTDHAIKLSSTWCGPFESCGITSYQYCQYSPDFVLQCEYPESEQRAPSKDIAPLIYDLPETVFLVLEVCDDDAFYCEYSSRRVELE